MAVASYVALDATVQSSQFPCFSVGTPSSSPRRVSCYHNPDSKLRISVASVFDPRHVSYIADEADPRSSFFKGKLRDVGIREALPEGRFLHAYIIYLGYRADLLLGNLLIQMYGRCKAMEDAAAVFASMPQKNVFTWTLFMGVLIASDLLDSAREVFDHMPERDVTAWNSLIAAYSQQQRDREALELFRLMRLRGFTPDIFTFVSVLAACAHLQDISKCRQIHAFLCSHGLESDQNLSHLLIHMYSKCESLRDTQQMFSKVHNHVSATWNALIAVHVKDGKMDAAFQAFGQMLLHGTPPDEITFTTLLNICVSEMDLCYGRYLHRCIVCAGHESNVVVGNAIISMYGRCRSLADALIMFNRMWQRNVVSWNAIITISSQHRPVRESLRIFSQMMSDCVEPNDVTFISLLDACAVQEALAEGNEVCDLLWRNTISSDVVVMTAALNMYGKCRSIEQAEQAFDSMIKRDVISWNAMIAACVHCTEFEKACMLFESMLEEGMQPNNVTFANVLAAAANRLAIDVGQNIHACILSDGLEPDLLVGNSLINMYNKCGCLDTAHIMFNRLPRQDLVSWNALIAACGQHGRGKEAFHIFQEMQRCGNVPNEVTFLSLLSACNHTGLVEEACHCFTAMEQAYRIAPFTEHYNVIVDVLGRAGRLEDAEEIIKGMPLEPMATTWMGLLGACRKHHDLKRGVESAARILHLDPDYNAAFVTLSNLQVQCDTDAETFCE